MSHTDKRKVVVSEFITLDGVFDADTMGEWLFPYRSSDVGRHIKEELDAADISLLGSTTYEALAGYWPHQKDDANGIADRLNSMRKYVVSRTRKDVSWNNSQVLSENIPAEIAKLKEKSGGDIVVGGSAQLVQTLLMPHDLVDEYRFTVFPIVFGRGKRFFKNDKNAVKLKLVESTPFSSGAILLVYQPDRS
jgi:dihydrofolate reductase